MKTFAGITLDRVETQPFKNGKIVVKFHCSQRTMVQREPLTFVETDREKRTYVYKVETTNVIEAIKIAKERYDGLSVELDFTFPHSLDLGFKVTRL